MAEKPGVDPGRERTVGEPIAIRRGTGRYGLRVYSLAPKLGVEFFLGLLVPGVGEELGLVVAERHDHFASGRRRLALESHHQVQHGDGLVTLVDEVAYGDEHRAPARPRVSGPGRPDQVRAGEESDEPVEPPVDISETYHVGIRGALDDGGEAAPVSWPHGDSAVSTGLVGLLPLSRFGLLALIGLLTALVLRRRTVLVLVFRFLGLERVA